MIGGWPQDLLWNPCGNCGQDPCECGRRSESREMTTVAGKWGTLSLRLNAAAKDGARTYLVLRARRIWGWVGGGGGGSIPERGETQWRASVRTPPIATMMLRV